MRYSEIKNLVFAAGEQIRNFYDFLVLLNDLVRKCHSADRPWQPQALHIRDPNRICWDERKANKFITPLLIVLTQSHQLGSFGEKGTRAIWSKSILLKSRMITLKDLHSIVVSSQENYNQQDFAEAGSTPPRANSPTAFLLWLRGIIWINNFN